MLEEKKYTGTDTTIFKRLMVYAKPYLWKIFFIFILLLLMSVLEIILPFITKTVIDKYIERSYIKVEYNSISSGILDKYKAYSIKFKDYYFIPSNIIKDYEYKILEKDSLIDSEKYYFINKKYESIINKHSIENIKTSSGMFVKYFALKDIQSEDIKKIRNNDIKNVKKYSTIYIAILFLIFILNYFQVVFMAIVSERIIFDVRSDLAKHVFQLSMDFFNKNPIGRIVTRITNDVDALRELFSDVLIYSAKDILIVVGVFAIMFKLSVQLAFVMLGLLPILAILLFLFQKFARKAYRKVRITLAKVNAYLSEAISGILLIKAFNMEDKSYNDFNKTSKDYYKANIYQLFIFSIFRPLIDVVSYITIAIIIFYGANGVLKGAISIGVLVAFISYIHMLFRPIFDFSEKFNVLQSALASSERIFLVLSEDKIIHSPKNPKKPEKVIGKIEFKNVSFSYKKGERVLKNVSFTINPNESIAFVGATGSGKTTIINLLMRFYDPDEGEILLDGINIKDMDISFLRNYFGLVLQDIILFSGSVKYNIKMNNDISDEKIIEYAKYVNAHYFIEKLPQKYDTIIEERGANLSTGQRQLIAFARALCTNPTILILDEATSNIDSETEQLIQDAIKKLMKNRTSIAIAHRLSTIQDVDRIYVLHKGIIKEYGTHTQLLNKKGLYYELYKFQYLT